MAAGDAPGTARAVRRVLEHHVTAGYASGMVAAIGRDEATDMVAVGSSADRGDRAVNAVPVSTKRLLG